MFGLGGFRNVMLLMAMLWLSGCAAPEAFVKTPSVNLASVELSKMKFSQQTFLLRFEVENPNAFPLPVKRISYKLMLEERKFAGGETQCDFTIPAGGEGTFVMSVDLDLLQPGTGLASIIRSGVRGDIEYELDGSLTVDIPLARPIAFSSTGTVAVQANRF